MALTSKKNNRTCIVCGTQYYHCGHCDEPIRPAWYAIFHDQNCHDIYDAVANIFPLKGKEAAKEALDKLDLSNKENFHPNIINAINEIYDIKDKNEVDKVDEIENVEENKTEEVKVEEVKKEKVETEEINESTTASTTDEKAESSKPSKEILKVASTQKKTSTVTKTNKIKK